MKFNTGNKGFFEGWYFKQSVDDKVISFIPGICVNQNNTHAFIQIITSWLDETFYIPFDYGKFSYIRNPFEVKIDENRFSLSGIEINIEQNGHSFIGKLGYTNMIPLSRSIFSPSIMGPFSYLPKMECNHGIISLGHDVWGNMSVDESEISFNNGRGYIESDWGNSFPKRWIWIQANSFKKDKECCIMAANADIPYAGAEFSGLIAVLHINGKQERFATYNGSRIMHIEHNNNRLTMWIRKGRRILEVSAKLNEGGKLFAPIEGGMDRIINEYMGEVSICLSDNNILLYDDYSPNATIEIV